MRVFGTGNSPGVCLSQLVLSCNVSHHIPSHPISQHVFTSSLLLRLGQAISGSSKQLFCTSAYTWAALTVILTPRAACSFMSSNMNIISAAAFQAKVCVKPWIHFECLLTSFSTALADKLP